MPSITTEPTQWTRALVNNSTDTAIGVSAIETSQPSSTDSTTPTGNIAIVPCGHANSVLLAPFGLISDNNAFVMSIELLSKTNGIDQWPTIKLGEFTCTVGSAADLEGDGTDTAGVLATESMCDTIAALSTANSDILKIGSIADETSPAFIWVDLLGFEYFKLQFDITTATDANALFKFVV